MSRASPGRSRLAQPPRWTARMGEAGTLTSGEIAERSAEHVLDTLAKAHADTLPPGWCREHSCHIVNCQAKHEAEADR